MLRGNIKANAIAAVFYIHSFCWSTADQRQHVLLRAIDIGAAQLLHWPVLASQGRRQNRSVQSHKRVILIREAHIAEQFQCAIAGEGPASAVGPSNSKRASAQGSRDVDGPFEGGSPSPRPVLPVSCPVPDGELPPALLSFAYQPC